MLQYRYTCNKLFGPGGFPLETISATDVDETLKIAKKIGKILQPKDILILSGELGAGKTTFTKGIALGLEIPELIKSPTYTLIREYSSGRLPLYHMDVYRVAEGADELGLDEYFESEGVCVVEWGKLIEKELPPDYLEITLHAQNDARTLTFQPVGSGGSNLFQRVKKTLKK